MNINAVEDNNPHLGRLQDGLSIPAEKKEDTRRDEHGMTPSKSCPLSAVNY